MSQKNLLLGRGEALTSSSPIKRGSGDKKYPYDLADIRKALAKPIERIETAMRELPPTAKPRGEAVFELTLHPAFLAKSYYPKKTLQQAGLRDVGSKEATIIPRKSTDPRDDGKKQATATLFVAGNLRAVETFAAILQSDRAPEGVKKELLEIEDIAWRDGASRIIGDLPDDETSHLFEVVLHAGADEEDIVAAFASMAKMHSAKADVGRKIRIGGLTFVPVRATSSAMRKLSDFSFLRVARPMPPIRVALPDVVRQTIQGSIPSLPTAPALHSEHRAAIFDGGLGTADLSPWAREQVYEETSQAHGQLLMHGNEVTSTFLFGRRTGDAPTLPQPYMAVDHYRVLSPSSGADPDLFDVLHRIKAALETGEYKFANLSLGPRLPIEDGEVHAWTATLDQLCSRYGILATVAVGNDGEVAGANRIQPPADMVNAIAVGAADSTSKKWTRAPYSCIGPGRSPGYVKPDGVAFGGSANEPFAVFNPLLGSVVGVQGTSYAAPLTLRTAAGISATTSYDMTAIALKALLVHHAERRATIAREEVGWGRFKEDPMQLLECEPATATVIFQGTLAKGEYLRCPIPMPSAALPGDVQISATLCIQAHTDPEHAVNYTRSGVGVTFRPALGVGDSSTSDFFGRATQYKASEREHRDGAHKWETCLHRTKTFRSPVGLAGPVFDIEYHAREQSRGVPAASAPDVRYALVVSIQAKDLPDLYDRIRQNYDVLTPVTLRVDIEADAA